MCISMLAYQRSHHFNLLQKFNSMYFKAHGTSAKAMDTLNVYGVGMCQKWSYVGINTISKTQNIKRNELIKTKPWRGGHDNLNISFKVYQPRIDNKAHFDSGTAGTIYIIHDPAAVMPSPMAFREKWREGVKSPITPRDILRLDAEGAPRIRGQAFFFVMKFLAGTPAFKFSTYEHKKDPVFARPPPVYQLPVGPEHVTDVYMLDTVHIEEASLEGNEKVLLEFARQVRSSQACIFIY